MKNLNSLWLTLLVVGIFILIFSIGFNVYEGISGANSTDFRYRVTAMPRIPLLGEELEEHFRESGEL